ncbi:hypothetical protein SCE1572_11185 [Sorangium cellulosum So0157-2]|uniref:Uncharacterized protein n=1 Tax=Sorangium cellulosum So0157-2 TaxID=1254432 RepID=S4XR96_SORCE|nr:hypothetical protein SCE1572_11185 [Sorangium cellulosum So0157-2]
MTRRPIRAAAMLLFFRRREVACAPRPHWHARGRAILVMDARFELGLDSAPAVLSEPFS